MQDIIFFSVTLTCTYDSDQLESLLGTLVAIKYCFSEANLFVFFISAFL